MDLTSAVVLGLILMGLVQLAKKLADGTARERRNVIICIVIGVGAVLLVGVSDFAKENVILDHPLADLNIWSQILVGLLAAGVASATWEIGSKAVSNIGENQPVVVVNDPNPPVV